MSKKHKALIIPHTHWDREWRYPIWQNRALLVRFMDELIGLLDADPDYACFLLDGQVVPVLDYLEIRPEMKEQVEEHVSSGRLIVGPWFTLPDLYPLDAECLIRNLQKGMRISEQFGKCPRRVAYHSFGWGQCSQFPQIYRQLGFDMVIAAKRVSKRRAPASEFIWRAPDGSEILTSRLGRHYRANGFFSVHIPLLFDVDFTDPDYRLNWEKSGLLIHWAESGLSDQDYFRADREQGYHPERLRGSLQEAWDNMDDSVCGEQRLIMYGSDFSTPNHQLTRIVKEANALFDDIEFEIADLEEYADILHSQLDLKQLRVVEGELRDGPANKCSANALAVRMPIKLLNKKVENLLLRKAEPLASMVYMLGAEYPVGMFAKAWEYMLKSHPHDSINGVGQDKSAADTIYRLEQAKEIAEVLCIESAAKLAGMLDTSRYAPETQLVLLVNPRPEPVCEIIEMRIDTPREQCVESFVLRDPAGECLRVQHIGRCEMKVPVNDFDARPWPFYVDRHDVIADTGVIPAGGYKLLEVVPEKHFMRSREWWPSQTCNDGCDISRAPRSLENEFLKVVAEPSGTVTLFDKSIGREFSGLLEFEDSGDSGDYWAHYKPRRNRLVYSAGGHTEIWIEENGPLSATLAIRIEMSLPGEVAYTDSKLQGDGERSGSERTLPIVSRLTLRHGERSLRVRTAVENCVADHRLRVLFPTDMQSDFADASGPFCVTRRSAPLLYDDSGKSHPEMQTQPMNGFVDISDGAQGFALVSNSFTEYELMDDERRTLAITLFRSVRNRICTEERCSSDFPAQRGGQSLERMEFEFALYPHAGDWSAAKVHSESARLNAAPLAFQISPAGAGKLQSTESLFELDSNKLVLSSVKKLEDRPGLALRIFNPSSVDSEGVVRISAPISAVHRINLNEERECPLKYDEGLRLKLAGGEITTIEIELHPSD